MMVVGVAAVPEQMNVRTSTAARRSGSIKNIYILLEYSKHVQLVLALPWVCGRVSFGQSDFQRGVQ